ncbi:MFS transporter [Novosphingobium sp. Gsoil 351]|uniref:MFS transporter n=1 Tax=Novosphingobium sp. Gsoil 351 TaxID=2675225 RepID=UPI0012B47D11|nr:MFS transporter [Novosphingobium sp. Gsoil 351]QGN53959.1 MFS transporter [Novosphingobium sp. Gsoil 351]
MIVLAIALALGQLMLGVFSAVQEAAKAELGLSDFALSLLNGLAVSIPVAVLSLPVGILVDRGNRVVLMVWTSFGWSVGTLLTAIAENLPLLFAARMLAGVGSNIATTIAISLAADLCLPERRGRSLLLLTIGKYAGTGLAFALGGALLSQFTTAGGLFDLSAWRSVHLLLGLLSLAGTATLLFLREPPRQEIAIGPSAPLRDTFAELWSYRRFLAPLFLGQLGVFMADASAAIWAAPVLQRSYGLGPGDFAGWMGLVIFGAGILGALIGGFAADLGQRRTRQGGARRRCNRRFARPAGRSVPVVRRSIRFRSGSFRAAARRNGVRPGDRDGDGRAATQRTARGRHRCFRRARRTDRFRHRADPGRSLERSVRR